MAKADKTRYVEEVNMVVGTRTPFLRIGSNWKKMRRVQRRLWRDARGKD